MPQARACSKQNHGSPQLHITLTTELFMAALGGGCWGFYLLVNCLRSLLDPAYLKASFHRETK